jgi:hypothetical protein
MYNGAADSDGHNGHSGLFVFRHPLVLSEQEAHVATYQVAEQPCVVVCNLHALSQIKHTGLRA